MMTLKENNLLMKFESIKPAKLSDSIVEQIEDFVLKGILKPGDKLPPERELAQQLDVSRPSLREALMRLEAKGLISSKRGGGTYVKDVAGPGLTDPLADLLKDRPEALFDVLELRHALEEVAAFYAAQRATEPDRELMQKRFDALQAVQDSNDLKREAAADLAFHLSISEASHNVALIHVMRSLLDLLQDNIFHNLDNLYLKKDNYAAVQGQHRAILNAILDRDAEAARQAAHEHLAYIAANMRALGAEKRREENSLLRLNTTQHQ